MQKCKNANIENIFVEKNRKQKIENTELIARHLRKIYINNILFINIVN